MSFNRKALKGKKVVEGEEKPKRKPKPVQDGITFDSPLELYVYNLLKEHGIKFELKRKFVLLPTFNYCGETIIGITLSADFYLTEHNIILDPKGHQHADNHLKWKMLRAHLLEIGEDPRICFVYSQKSAREFIHQLNTGFKDDVKDKFINGRVKRLKKIFKLAGDTFLRPNGEPACKLVELRQMTDYDLYQLLKSSS